MSERVIAHFDMDAFYVSVELLRRPELRGKPVVVAGNGPRAVVTTASYEARRFGVFSATPAARARRLCPQAVFLTPDFNVYREASRQVMEVMSAHFDRLEIVGLDEAYADLTGIERPRAAVTRAREEIRRKTGLRCSIGAGPNKLVAKMSSDLEKPEGLVFLTREEARRRFSTSPPRLVPGIGPRTAERLEEHGVVMIADLAATDEALLVEWFGPRLGPHLGDLARFDDNRAVDPVRVRKSESRETTFNEDISSRERLSEELSRLAGELCTEMKARGHSGRTIGIKVRLDDFSTHTRAKTLPEATCDQQVVLPVAQALLQDFDPQRPVRLIGVRVAGMDEGTSEPSPTPRGQLELTL
ncbi:MAG: polymerase [Thermoleophilaceae bacterium]|jgi:DNA polymerase-4|nr:polymerase [Thermoleophilaceae bacterium]